MSVANGTFTRTQGFMPEKDGIVPRFFLEQVEDPLASQRQGRPIFFDQERVELLIPGNPYNTPVEVVNASHMERWPEAYKRFKDGQEMAASGTPLEQWSILKPAQVRELKAINLFTVEHVADMNDHTIQRMMGGVRLKNLAKAYLDDAERDAILTRATADNDRKDARIAELEHKVGELTSILNSIHGEMQAMKNAPHPLQSHIPASVDPSEQMKLGMPVEAGASSLDSLPDLPRRRGRAAAQAEATS